MIKSCLLSLLFFLFTLDFTIAQVQPEIIPMPASYKLTEGEFLWDNKVGLSKSDFPDQGTYLQQEALRLLGITLSESESPAKSISIRKSSKLSRGYKISIHSKEVIIEAADEEGAFYGVISLLQLAHAAEVKSGKLSLPNWEIQDQPRYEWRGVMLDESRYFFGMDKVKQLLDHMAYYKLNIFHWHLTDAPGWRIEIKGFPKLATVGGIGNQSDPNAPATYYTQEEIKEIVRYASERMITVVPEIDMPGHATAANRAYPEHSGGGSEKYPDFTFHPAKETTYGYLSKILREVDVLFPSNMIHLGGDEVSFGNQMWPKDPKVLDLIKNEGLNGMKGVEDYFFERMADTLFQMNNKVLAWDEMAGANLPKDQTIIFWWRHDKKEQLSLSLQNGYATVICPRIPFYFDFLQQEDHKYGRKWAGAFAPLTAVYDFEVNDFGVKPEEKSLILGIQANLWTETVDNEQRFDYLMYPRIAALAEVVWSQKEVKSYSGFMDRLSVHLEKYKAEKLYYYDPFDPNHHPEPVYEP
ncbi:beta-N-acetylhexosaminidase [Cyclobacterium qasimii]|uniref:beta-N-acetylhexosaminidase n=2 Tax=Cyclobacterium qasimii TaxID=1350429 RepID=S7VIC0_9BACT|nr:beta-N-acetylhexosaminidase [Cyclobacterium qasimii]EPR69262.1 Beta-hexosaminidase [Cyclobacterium qasimii M12-11B]GEO20957.1 beta-hexosaminidase [Cyclobacterium qasimii]